MGKITVVVGGQYGSEGKGAMTAWLARKAKAQPTTKPRTTHGQWGRAQARPPLLVRVAGPNAGHTAYDDLGNKWALRQIPVGAVANLRSRLAIAAGSEVDEVVLEREIAELEGAGIPIRNRLLIDRSATRLQQHHIEAEGGYGGHLTSRLGSTGKGVGAARSDRIWRNAEVWGGIDDVVTTAYQHLANDHDVIIEGTQGFGLGLHEEHYPHCTSSDCRAIDFLSMAGISPWHNAVEDVRVLVVCRTYPIRVAGNSGDLHEEISWDMLGRRSAGRAQPEFTTVTKMMRRVGEWDSDLVKRAVAANGGYPKARVALTMVDYVFPELADCAGAWYDQDMILALGEDLHRKVEEWVRQIEQEIGTLIPLLGTGPNTVIVR